MTGLFVRTFGTFEVSYQDRLVSSFETRLEQELLAYLVLHPDYWHNRDKLVELLWPEVDPASGRKRLSTVLWRLKKPFKKIGYPIQKHIQSTKDAVKFELQKSITVDLFFFRQMLQKAERQPQNQQTRTALESALAIYRRPFLEEISARWCETERHYIEGQRLQALLRLLEICYQQHQYGRAIKIGQMILSIDPVQEKVHQTLMQCYTLVQRQDLVMRQFKQCATLLQRELGVPPHPETIQIYQRSVQAQITDIKSTPSDEVDQALQAFLVALNHLNTVILSQ